MKCAEVCSEKRGELHKMVGVGRPPSDSDSQTARHKNCAAHLYIAEHRVRHISILRHTVCGTSLYCSTPCGTFILFCGTTIFADNSYLHRLPPRVFLSRRSVYNYSFIIHTAHDSVIVWQCRVTSQTGQTWERKCKVVGQTSQTGQTYDCHFSRRRRRMPRLKKRTISDFWDVTHLMQVSGDVKEKQTNTINGQILVFTLWDCLLRPQGASASKIWDS